MMLLDLSNLENPGWSVCEIAVDRVVCRNPTHLLELDQNRYRATSLPVEMPCVIERCPKRPTGLLTLSEGHPFTHRPSASELTF